MSKIFVERVEEQYLDYDENQLTCYKGKPYTGIGYYSFDDGVGVAYEVNYQDGHEHGLKRKWFSRSKLEYEYPMFRGMGHGRQKTWHPNGQLKEDAIVEYGIVLKGKV
jgi:antitoxin component YwqK of YwqJK toxin-antitoxin module